MSERKHVVILTGAGISAESGIATFRDAEGLWEGHDIMEVASPFGWEANPELVLDFYNQRRKNLREVEPNDGHRALVELEEFCDVSIITQNVDDLHERAGSTKVLHLHGELFKVRSTGYPSEVLDWREDLNAGDLCSNGSQLRPHIVWFGEEVPMMEPAIEITRSADYFVVIGTSLVVYPAAGLLTYADPNIPKFLIDPNEPTIDHIRNLTYIGEKATTGVRKLVDYLRKTTL